MSGVSNAPWIVVKLGGSLAGDPSLAHWLRELACDRSARFVAVPGGGPFADAVRAAQDRWQFSDEVAHLMAVGAMDQFAQMMCGIEKGSIPCSTLRRIQEAWTGSQLPVWLPGWLMRRDRRLPRCWDVTSDTIAAWLANELHASGLLLVKSCNVPPDLNDPAVLAARGVIDAALPDYLSNSALALKVVHKSQWSELSQIVRSLLSGA